MKKLLLLLLIPFLSFGQDLTYVPDSSLEYILEVELNNSSIITLNDDNELPTTAPELWFSDNYVLTSSLNTITQMYLLNQDLSGDFTGLEDCPMLNAINAPNNSMESVVLPFSENILDLQLNDCPLITNIDLSNLPNLEVYRQSQDPNNVLDGGLISINLSNNPSLWSLELINNDLTELDFSQNISLTSVNIRNNQLIELDFSNNPNLTWLWCNYNDLVSVNLSQNTQLTYLECNYNNLTQLDVSQNTALTTLYCVNNPFLSCIQVWDVGYAEANFMKDDNAIWSLDCGYETSIQELLPNKKLITTIDVLGRPTNNNKGFQLHIYDDGSVEKKYLIK